jgi:hypothetical protein
MQGIALVGSAAVACASLRLRGICARTHGGLLPRLLFTVVKLSVQVAARRAAWRDLQIDPQSNYPSYCGATEENATVESARYTYIHCAMSVYIILFHQQSRQVQ